MPDLERITDDMNVFMASTPEEKSYAKGFANGKTSARLEIAYIASLFFVIYCFAKILQHFT